MLFIMDDLSIPLREIRISAVRSSGPGGQHVNTAATKAVLRFNLDRCSVLTQFQKMIIRGKLRRRIGKDGCLTLACQTQRSFEQNREEALSRFASLLAEALTPVLERVRSGVPGGQRRRRLDAKKRRASIKKARGAVSPGGEE
ncbi:MAG: alternative ribosome rescue aminoacyl-tRNA hydrolase ArfB [Desulfovibrionaceae bacterium]